MRVAGAGCRHRWRVRVQMEDAGALQVIEELEELMQSSPDPEADPEGDEDEEEEEEEETEADADGEGGGGGTEPILLRELCAFSPAFNNNCSHEGTDRKIQASRFLGTIPTNLDN